MSGTWSPTAATHVAAVIGDPVRHSLSPTILNAAFRDLGLDWVYLAFEVPDGKAPEALDAMRVLGLDGLSVTMPHKTATAAAVDRLSPDAAALGAVNCVVRRGDELVGENTDGVGFLAALVADTGYDPTGGSCAVVGAGGAARAVVLALARAGAAEVLVVNRTRGRAEAAAQLAGRVGRVGTERDLADVDLVVQATPVGMGSIDAADATPFDPDLLHRGQVLVDLIYQPAQTALLAAAGARGVTVANGVGMLVHQAAVAFELWTGKPAPLAAMTAALRHRLLTH